MTNSRLMNVLQGPVVSEKANAVQANNTIVFKVLKGAVAAPHARPVGRDAAAVRLAVQFTALVVVLTGRRPM